MDGQHVKNSPNDLYVSKYDFLKAKQVIRCSDPQCVAIHDNGDTYVGSLRGVDVFDQKGQLENTMDRRYLCC